MRFHTSWVESRPMSRRRSGCRCRQRRAATPLSYASRTALGFPGRVPFSSSRILSLRSRKNLGSLVRHFHDLGPVRRIPYRGNQAGDRYGASGTIPRYQKFVEASGALGLFGPYAHDELSTGCGTERCKKGPVTWGGHEVIDRDFPVLVKSRRIRDKQEMADLHPWRVRCWTMVTGPFSVAAASLYTADFQGHDG